MQRLLLLCSLAVTLTAAAILPATASSLAAPCTPGATYNSACDVDQNGTINITDIQLTAGHWNQSGPFTSGSWDLAGNAGTAPGTDFVGTTDNTALELRVNGQRGLRIEPTAATPNVVGGHTTNGVAVSHTGATIAGGGSAGSTCGPSLNAPCSNRVLWGFGAIGGGYANTASAYAATVGGGDGNTASGGYTLVSGGQYNTASDAGAAVGGGRRNVASGEDATIPGGADNLASGDFSFAAGRRAKANNPGAFVLADSNNFDLAPGVNNALTARFTGGARFILGINASGASTWLCAVYNGGSWGCSSDRNVKENFQPVDSREVLQRLMTVPITTWNAIGTDPSVRRMGPMSQDFHAAFGLGDDDTVITTGDLDGVALASIQGLYEIVQEKDEQIVALQQENADLQARLAAIERALGIGQ
jgi:hypothetical protein